MEGGVRQVGSFFLQDLQKYHRQRDSQARQNGPGQTIRRFHACILPPLFIALSLSHCLFFFFFAFCDAFFLLTKKRCKKVSIYGSRLLPPAFTSLFSFLPRIRSIRWGLVTVDTQFHTLVYCIHFFFFNALKCMRFFEPGFVIDPGVLFTFLKL